MNLLIPLVDLCLLAKVTSRDSLAMHTTKKHLPERFFEVEVVEAVDNVVIAVMLLRVLLALWNDTPELFRQRSEDELDMRLFELVLLAEPRPPWPYKALLALSLRLSDSDEAVVVLARFNRNLRIRKMSDILCCGDLRPPPPPPYEVCELLEAPDEVVRSLVLPTSRVPMKQCVSAMIEGITSFWA